MKLIDPPRNSSFYESFSDLIFGTLCIFIVIVIALSLKLEVEVANVVSPSRFQGGADETRMYTATVLIDDKWHLVWLPAVHADNLSLDHPLVDMKKKMIQEIADRQYPVVPIERLESMQSALVGNIRHVTPYGVWAWAQVYYHASKRDPEAIAAGRKRGSLLKDLDQASVRSDYGNAYLRNHLRGNSEPYRSLWSQHLAPLASRSEATSEQRPCVRFRSREIDGQREVLLGDVVFTPSQFRVVLRSLKPGAGFYVEHLDDTGTPAVPPDWVQHEILEKSGFSGRVVSDAGMAVLAN